MATKSKRKITSLVLPPGANTDLQIIQDTKTPVAKWVRVTPELATKWLESNTNNRTVRDSHVLRLAADMKAGKWKGRNGEAIGYTTQERWKARTRPWNLFWNDLGTD